MEQQASPGLRAPRQARSRASLERMLTAGADVLAERGYEGLSIAEVCRRADVSAGALYTRFDGKDALVHAVHDDVMARLSAELEAQFAPDEAWDRHPTPDFVEHAIRLLLAHFREHAAIIRAIVLRSAVDPVMRASGARYVAGMANAFTALLLRRAADYPHSAPEPVVRSAFAMAFEAVSWDVAFGSEFRADGALGEPLEVRLPALGRMLLLTPPD